jgi:hypothetical protein
MKLKCLPSTEDGGQNPRHARGRAFMPPYSPRSSLHITVCQLAAPGYAYTCASGRSRFFCGDDRMAVAEAILADRASRIRLQPSHVQRRSLSELLYPRNCGGITGSTGISRQRSIEGADARRGIDCQSRGLQRYLLQRYLRTISEATNASGRTHSGQRYACSQRPIVLSEVAQRSALC